MDVPHVLRKMELEDVYVKTAVKCCKNKCSSQGDVQSQSFP